MMALKIYTQQPVTRKRQRVDVRRVDNVISADFGREVRERNARWAEEDAKLSRTHLIDSVMISLVVIGLIVLLVKSWPAA
jgi:hypothetical protein